MQSTLGATPATVAAERRRQRRELGRFVLGEVLGEGGMGRVYEAFDPRLSRRVAVKVLRSDDPEAVRRFIHEARSQARLSHPHICPVFEAGEVEGAPYIVMRRIAGRPLHQATELSLEQKLAVLVQVAEAVYEAHRAGPIHRDLKPGNILVEAAPDGGSIPYMLDFGLARAGGRGEPALRRPDRSTERRWERPPAWRRSSCGAPAAASTAAPTSTAWERPSTASSPAASPLRGGTAAPGRRSPACCGSGAPDVRR